MGLIDKLVGIIIVVIFAFYLLINAFVPQLSGWADDLSSVNATDYGWIVYLIFLVIIFAIAYAVVKKMGLGGAK
jgi:succinate dehydrogenase/fumarate reductase cytochrome b subunit